MKRLLLIPIALLGVVAASTPAWADAQGPCQGSLNGIDAAARSASDPGDAVKVGANDTVEVIVESQNPIDSYKVQLSFAGFRWTVAEGTASGTTWTRSVEVKKYSRFGVGLYRVHAVSGGAASCEGALLVRIGGSPLATVAGWVALGLTGLGVGATAAAAIRPGPRVPVGSMALGALGGLGAVALLQQFGVAYPTRILALIGIGVGAAAPLVARQVSRASAPAGPAPPSAPAEPPPGPPGDLWVPDRVVPPEGVQSWSGPEGASAPAPPLEGGVEIRLLDRAGDRVLVECSNGWTTWVDANALEGTIS